MLDRAQKLPLNPYRGMTSRSAAQPGCVTHKAERGVGGVEKPLLLKKARRERQTGQQGTTPTFCSR